MLIILKPFRGHCERALIAPSYIDFSGQLMPVKYRECACSNISLAIKHPTFSML